MEVVGIIPARLASSRFPRKPLVKIFGKSMIEHVYQRAKHARQIDKVYVATCDLEIAEEVKRFGGEAIMTSVHHTRGTDRVAEAANSINADIIINIQGDEPMVDPEVLDNAVNRFKLNPDLQCLNMICLINNWTSFLNPNMVKAVIDCEGKVLYFSRQPIPNTVKDKFKQAYKQMGIYLFRRNFLMTFSRWRQTPLEQAESVDMMRIIEHGFPIHTHLVKDMIGVDTPEDLIAVERALTSDPWCQRILKA